MKAAPAEFVPLQSGDRLSREEFHRRYCQHPNLGKAELINGVVYVHSPVRYRYHGEQQKLAFIWLDSYAIVHPGLDAAFDVSVFLTDDGEVQPDAMLFRVQGGSLHRNEDGYLVGAPEAAFEIAASTAAYDLHDKMELYRRAGVQEYIVWSVLENRIDWWRLHDGQYVPLQPNAAGMIESKVFPGLCLDVTKMLALDRAGILAALR